MHMQIVRLRNFPKSTDLMAKTTGAIDADILWNQASLLVARSQRALESLLGPPNKGNDAKAQAQLEREDAEAFKPEADEL